MNRADHLLTCLAEEAVEVAKNATKALRFGLDDREPDSKDQRTNAERIVAELLDLYGIAEMLNAEGLIKFPEAEIQLDAYEAKRERTERFLDYSRSKGRLEP